MLDDLISAITPNPSLGATILLSYSKLQIAVIKALFAWWVL